MQDLETRELRYFVAVAEELHFGRAAALPEIADRITATPVTPWFLQRTFHLRR